jgi:hypothetical protein
VGMRLVNNRLCVSTTPTTTDPTTTSVPATTPTTTDPTTTSVPATTHISTTPTVKTTPTVQPTTTPNLCSKSQDKCDQTKDIFSNTTCDKAYELGQCSLQIFVDKCFDTCCCAISSTLPTPTPTTPHCIDLSNDCTDAVNNTAICNTRPGFYYTQCQRTCGNCDCNVNCEDVSNQCDVLLKNNFCGSKQAKELCWQTCGNCEGCNPFTTPATP